MFDFTKIKRVHMLGIGGASMQNLALLSQRLGMTVSGSDMVNTHTIKFLNDRGIDACVGSDCSAIDRADLVVYSSAIDQNDTQLLYANSHGKMVLERKKYLAYVSSLFARVIGIAGSHGKSTTSAMVSFVLDNLNCNLTTHLGCKPIGSDSFIYSDKHDIFVCEACEYRRSFLELSSFVGVITCIDYDHPDTYPTRQSLYEAFGKFVQNSQNCIMSEQAKEILQMPCISYGFGSDNDYIAINIKENRGKYSCTIKHREQSVHISLNVYGKFNILNALCCVAVCNTLGYDMVEIVSILEKFCGIERRFECKGKMDNGARVIIDYAHHPTEIAQSISTASRIAKGKVWTIFQPHTYSRTAMLMQEFVDSFYWSDEIILLPTYSAREVESDGMSSWELYKKMFDNGQVCIYMEDWTDVVSEVQRMSDSDDIILVLGAGDIYKMGDMLLGGYVG